MATFAPLPVESLAVNLANTVGCVRGRDVDLIADEEALAAWLDPHPTVDPSTVLKLRGLRDAIGEVFRSSVECSGGGLAVIARSTVDVVARRNLSQCANHDRVLREPARQARHRQLSQT